MQDQFDEYQHSVQTFSSGGCGLGTSLTLHYKMNAYGSCAIGQIHLFLLPDPYNFY